MSLSSIFPTIMNHHFWALKALEFNFQPLFSYSKPTNLHLLSFPLHFHLKNSHNFHFHKHKLHIFEFFISESLKAVLFVHIWSLAGWEGWKRALHQKKITIYMVFIIFQICVEIVDCFVCLWEFCIYFLLLTCVLAIILAYGGFTCLVD